MKDVELIIAVMTSLDTVIFPKDFSRFGSRLVFAKIKLLKVILKYDFNFCHIGIQYKVLDYSQVRYHVRCRRLRDEPTTHFRRGCCSRDVYRINEEEKTLSMVFQ